MDAAENGLPRSFMKPRCASSTEMSLSDLRLKHKQRPSTFTHAVWGVTTIGGGRNNAPATVLLARSAFPKRRTQRSPNKQRNIERRRRLAASGPLPPQLAAHFTTGEFAVLRIVGDEVRQHGACALYIDAIAARAGVCRTTAQNAIREVRALGLVTVEERRRRGQPSLTNIVRVISSAWLAWLRIGPKGPGFKLLNSTVSRSSEQAQHRGSREPRTYFLRRREIGRSSGSANSSLG
jgi:hypothetical protein